MSGDGEDHSLRRGPGGNPADTGTFEKEGIRRFPGANPAGKGTAAGQPVRRLQTQLLIERRIIDILPGRPGHTLPESAPKWISDGNLNPANRP